MIHGLFGGCAWARATETSHITKNNRAHVMWREVWADAWRLVMAEVFYVEANAVFGPKR